MEKSKTFLAVQIGEFERKTSLIFKPSKGFYQMIGINQKRFWQIERGDKKPLMEEFTTIENYFKNPLTTLI